MAKLDPDSISAADFLIDLAATQRSAIGAADAAALAQICGLGEGEARTRLLIAHLQDGDEASSVTLCTDAIGKRLALALYCHGLLNHAPSTGRTMRTFIGVVQRAMPTHAAARMKLAQPLEVRALYDAVWSGDQLAAIAPIAEGFAETFEGVLVSTEQPLLYHSTFKVARREGEKVLLSLGERDNFSADDFWVAPPCIMIAGTLGPVKARSAILQAKLRRGWRRLISRLNR